MARSGPASAGPPTLPPPGSDRGATLEPLLGRERYVALQELLIARAVEWAQTVAPGAVHVAFEPAGAGPALRARIGSGPSLFPQNGAGLSGRLANAGVRAFARGGGPMLIVWPDLPRWRPEHAEAALTDLGDGCGLSVGPVFDGGFYLVALARLLPALFALPADTWRSADAMGIALMAAHHAGIEVGLLRAERGLHRPEDVRAALADPLLDLELRRLLR
jgi:glycosyltransferase A (GT-A) superfamily protein (DUF2064 family)